ncbi:unnamed protein product [Plutella xylostella]|uniref:(diamondback moth) hypothetical protein n=1 Tax=Plutella xylostella TaxID=51655 RepID=A0A8S4FGI3_PLUXY|nr:unnamed protein product [Plutella xylostella]
MDSKDDLKDICDKFAENFSNDIEQIKHACDDKWISRDNYVNKANVSMRWQPVSNRAVKRVISDMAAGKAPGSDLVRMADLKLMVDEAFDTLDTDTLLNAMEECGVGRPLNQWFREYLTARSYRVKVADTLSAEQRVRSGVPQGSGLPNTVLVKLPSGEMKKTTMKQGQVEVTRVKATTSGPPPKKPEQKTDKKEVGLLVLGM